MHTIITILHIISLLITQHSCLDNGLARTPPMGWMSWQRYRCQIDCERYPDGCINENLILNTAKLLSQNGWGDVGYRYLIIDDCWMEKKRDPHTNEIVPDMKRFSKPLGELGKHIQSLSLKFGIYLDYGLYTCEGYPGSMNYLEIDAQSLVKWNVDYVKMDGCYAPQDQMPDGYEKFSQLMNKTGRPIVFSCSYPAYVSWIKSPEKIDWERLQRNCNLWRMLGDVQDSWSSVLSIINAYKMTNSYLPKFAGPGHWNDPDMLLLGNFGLSHDQQRVQMGMWCMFAAPLIMSNDLSNIDTYSETLLKNLQLIAIDQDKGGHQAEYVKTSEDVQFWVRPLSDDPAGWAIALVYPIDGGGPKLLDISISEFQTESYKITGDQFNLVNVFQMDVIRTVSKDEKFTISVNPSGIAMFRIYENREKINILYDVLVNN